jgi:hypothetical protein
MRTLPAFQTPSRGNAVALGIRGWQGSSDGDGLGRWLGWLGPVAVGGGLDPEVGHLAFHNAGLAAQPSSGQQVRQEVIPQPDERADQALRGKRCPVRW